MGLSECKPQNDPQASSNDKIDCQFNRDRKQFADDYYDNKKSIATGICEDRRDHFIYSIDSASSETSAPLISDTDIPVIMKCDSCELSNVHELYDWEFVDSNILQTALNFKKELKSWSNNKKELRKKIFSINNGYLTLRLDDIKYPFSIDEVRSLFKTAMQDRDPNSIIKAYTTSQAFSKFLNQDMARIVMHDIKNGCSKFSCDIPYAAQDGTKSTASILYHHPDLTEYQGKLYCGMLLRNELAHFQVGCCIMTNTFLSTSKMTDVADLFFEMRIFQSNILSRTWEIRLNLLYVYYQKYRW